MFNILLQKYNRNEISKRVYIESLISLNQNNIGILHT